MTMDNSLRLAGSPRDVVPDHVIDEAIAWVVRLHYDDPDNATRTAFEQWLKEDAAHVHGWERLIVLQQEIARMPQSQARATLDGVNARRGAQSAQRRQALKILSLGGIGLLSVFLVREHAPWQRLIADHSTVVGEQRRVHLDDGTEIMLNTDTAISTDFHATGRIVTLHRGEIFITTGADNHPAGRRPFHVHTPFGVMQALGTRFSVRLDEHQARLSVVEHAVRLYPESGIENPVADSGSYWSLRRDKAYRLGVSPINTIDWVDGVIAAKNLPLGDLLAELARYRSGRVDCDPSITELPISGVYHVQDTDQALQFLQQTQPISVSYLTRYWVRVRPLQPHE